MGRVSAWETRLPALYSLALYIASHILGVKRAYASYGWMQTLLGWYPKDLSRTNRQQSRV